ncbi:MAG: hypothetical protein ACYDHY_17390 [Acidiferrobacterales bacterium]
MPRTVPNINGVRITGVTPASLTGGNIVQTVSYAPGWYLAGPPVAFHDAPPYLYLGKGNVTVTETANSSAQAVQTAVIGAVAAAEGLSSGDVVLLPDGTVVTL